MLPRTLALLVTYQCTAACSQCCFGCHPNRHERIPQERILAYIDQSASMGSVLNVVFSGGESFLLGRDLTEAVARATGHGLSTRCVTNAYWATSSGAARQRLQELHSAGLKELNVSTGDFHQEFVPAERVAHAALAAYELGMGIVITVETRQERAFTAGLLLKGTIIGEIHRQDPEGMRIRENVWIPMDRDRSFEHDESLYRNPSNPHLMRSCTSILSHMAVTPAEEYLACCGLVADQIPELHLGDTQREPLLQIARRADKDLLRIWIRLEGPERIVDYLQKRDPSIQYSWDNVHHCQTCRDLFQREDLRAALLRYAHEPEAEILMRYHLWQETADYLEDASPQ
jgi:hypothetical protein